MYLKAYFSETGEVTFTDVVPDTTREFVASAFALNTTTGLGVAPIFANVRIIILYCGRNVDLQLNIR